MSQQPNEPDQFNAAESALYTHPDIRNAKSAQYIEHLERVRARRLVGALEHRNIARDKIAKEHEATSKKWIKLDERIAKKLQTMEADLNKLEDWIEQLSAHAHNLTFLESGDG